MSENGVYAWTVTLVWAWFVLVMGTPDLLDAIVLRVMP